MKPRCLQSLTMSSMDGAMGPEATRPGAGNDPAGAGRLPGRAPATTRPGAGDRLPTRRIGPGLRDPFRHAGRTARRSDLAQQVDGAQPALQVGLERGGGQGARRRRRRARGSRRTVARSPPRMRRIRSRQPGSSAGPRRCSRHSAPPSTGSKLTSRLAGRHPRPRRMRTHALVQHGRHPFESQQLPVEGRHQQRGRGLGASQGPQRAGEHAVERGVGFALLGDLIDRLDQRDGVGQTVEVLAERRIVVEGLGLGDHVELPALRRGAG